MSAFVAFLFGAFFGGIVMFVFICPYCGCALPTDLGYEDFPEIYEEGDHKLTCPECDKDFRLTTRVSYSWETERIKDNEQDSND